jgi:hypothetical protein
MPKTLVSMQSSAYCTGAPSLGISDFILQFEPNVTELVETESGWGTDVLKTATAVSLYFTTTFTDGSVAQTTAPTALGSGQSATARKTGSGTALASGTAGVTGAKTGGARGVRVVGMGACLSAVLVVLGMAVN